MIADEDRMTTERRPNAPSSLRSLLFRVWCPPAASRVSQCPSPSQLRCVRAPPPPVHMCALGRVCRAAGFFSSPASHLIKDHSTGRVNGGEGLKFSDSRWYHHRTGRVQYSSNTVSAIEPGKTGRLVRAGFGFDLPLSYLIWPVHYNTVLYSTVVVQYSVIWEYCMSVCALCICVSVFLWVSLPVCLEQPPRRAESERRRTGLPPRPRTESSV